MLQMSTLSGKTLSPHLQGVLKKHCEAFKKEHSPTRSLKLPHTAHMCGGPKQFGGTKELVDQKTY